MHDLPHIPSSYAESRELFRQHARSLGWQHAAYPLPGSKDSEDLTIDAVWSRAPQNRPLLIVSSGLHGVEGPFGAAVQLAVLEWLQSHSESLGNIDCLLLHALNPYGFAHSRRFDADNVDPNRNFLLPHESHSGCPPAYRQLDPLLNPKSPPRGDWFLLKAALAIVKHGMPALQAAVAGGQYEFPLGLFFGGNGPCATQRVLEAELSNWIGDATIILHLDFHTGLGRWKAWKLLLDHPISDLQEQRLVAMFGRSNLSLATASTIAYQARGSLGQWCSHKLPGRDYVYACAEFGTRSPLSILAALRQENCAHHWSGNEQDRQRTKQKLREMFVPASPQWRASTISTGVDLVRHAIETLSGTPRQSG